MSPKHLIALTGLGMTLILPLGACANTPWAQSLQQSLAADPRLEDNSALFGAGDTSSPASNSAEPQTETAQLPSNFPAEIPRYPNAELTEVSPASEDSALASETETRWTTSDRPEQVRQFYQNAFGSDGWQLVSPAANQTESTNEIVAERGELRATVAIEPTSQNAAPSSPVPDEGTEFAIAYTFSDGTTAQAESSSTSTASANGSAPQPGDPEFVGPVPPEDWTTANNSASESPSGDNSASGTQFSDLDQAPEELRQYVTDLVELGALKITAASNGNANSGASASQFQPNQAVTRREYARWLVSTNNLIYANQPARKIRLATDAAQPVFQDVPESDPDFSAIQGLAEAGLIPSSLSGDSTTVTFRPNAPLTREDLLLWKVPIDLRQTLPTATVDAVQKTWGFQDANRIDPRALRAVLADYQNGDLSNIRRAFGYTTLLQPKKTVTRAEAAAALWYIGQQGEGISAQDALQSKQQPSN
jgi:hypothetical protein